MRHKTNEFFCPKHTGDLSHLSFGPNPPFLQVLIPGTSVTLTKSIGGLTKSNKKSPRAHFFLISLLDFDRGPNSPILSWLIPLFFCVGSSIGAGVLHFSDHCSSKAILTEPCVTATGEESRVWLSSSVFNDHLLVLDNLLWVYYQKCMYILHHEEHTYINYV
jgi:hypothetical protein